MLEMSLEARRGPIDVLGVSQCRTDSSGSFLDVDSPAVASSAQEEDVAAEVYGPACYEHAKD